MSALETRMFFDETQGREGSLIMDYRQDAQYVLDWNQRLYNQEDRSHVRGLPRVVASVPMGVVMEWYKEGLNILGKLDEYDQKRLHERLNSKDWLKLRTSPGNI